MEQVLLPIGHREAAAWSRRLIDTFGSLPATLAASRTAQQGVIGAGAAVDHLQSVNRVMRYALRVKALSGPVLSTSSALLDYLRLSLAAEPTEQLRVLYLNARNALVLDTVLSKGSTSEVPIYPREVVRYALESGATALILVHNHPSGDPAPSADDVLITHRVGAAAAIFDIRLHDHIIIARDGWSSLAALGLLGTAKAT